MTRQQAETTVRNTFDDDYLSHQEQVEIFAGIFGREPEDDEYGLEWSLAVAATPGVCSCLTRREHERGNCR